MTEVRLIVSNTDEFGGGYMRDAEGGGRVVEKRDVILQWKGDISINGRYG